VSAIHSPYDADVSGSTGVVARLVEQILRTGCEPEVAVSVVLPIAVYVVNIHPVRNGAMFQLINRSVHANGHIPSVSHATPDHIAMIVDMPGGLGENGEEIVIHQDLLALPGSEDGHRLREAAFDIRFCYLLTLLGRAVISAASHGRP
jgi:hypothetical protein